MRRAYLWLLVVGLLAGCVQREAPAPETERAPSAAMEGAPAPAADESDAVAEAPPPLPSWEGIYSVTVQAPGLCRDEIGRCSSYANQVTRPVFTLDVNESDPRFEAATHFRFFAEWTPKTDAAAVIRFRLERDDGTQLDLGKGPSPFVVEIPKERLALGEEYAVQPYPDLPGAFVDQTVKVTLDIPTPRAP